MQKHININLNIAYFKVDNIHFYHCPSLDLTGYGYNKREAFKSLKVILQETLNYNN